MASILSTVLSRLNTFLDSEMEQLLCFDTAIDAEKFCNEKSAIFIVLPEEDTTKYAIVPLLLQNLYREILAWPTRTAGSSRIGWSFTVMSWGPAPQDDPSQWARSKENQILVVEKD